MKPNFGDMLKQAQRMQAEMAKVQEQLRDERVHASVGGGVVKIVMTGDMRVESVAIDPAAVDPDDVGMLEDMTAAAFNEALRMAQELASEKMAGVTGGLNMPGLM